MPTAPDDPSEDRAPGRIDRVRQINEARRKLREARWAALPPEERDAEKRHYESMRALYRARFRAQTRQPVPAGANPYDWDEEAWGRLPALDGTPLNDIEREAFAWLAIGASPRLEVIAERLALDLDAAATMNGDESPYLNDAGEIAITPALMEMALKRLAEVEAIMKTPRVTKLAEFMKMDATHPDAMDQLPPA